VEQIMPVLLQVLAVKETPVEQVQTLQMAAAVAAQMRQVEQVQQVSAEMAELEPRQALTEQQQPEQVAAVERDI
jgi:hypothetical protein